MAARRRSSRSQSWSLLKRKQALVQFVLAMSALFLLSLVSAEEVEMVHHISTLERRTEMHQEILQFHSRRALLQGAMQDRQAPRSFPPPQGNAFVNNPGNAPPGRPFFGNRNGRPAARIPDNARRLVPPPHP